MDYRGFLNEIKENILNFMPENYANAEVRIDGVMKNNGILRQGISMHRDTDAISPKLYLDEFYNSYKAGVSMDDICSRIAEEYVEHSIEGKEFDISVIGNYENTKDYITTKVVAAKSNKTLLRERPSKKLDDLAVFYQIDLSNSPEGKASIAITNQMMKSWNVTVDDIHKIAIDNTERISPAKLVALESVLFGEEENLLDNANTYEECSMLVLTNEEKIGGANILANVDALSKVADVINDSYYILPSSVHEVLIIPKEIAKEMDMTPKDLGNMVRDVNSSEVSKEERLSDHIYEFDKDKKTFETVMDSKEKKKDHER